MPFCTSNRVSLHYDIEGQGPPLCLISGYRLSGAVWPRRFITRLATSFSVISFDHRGTGLSDKPDGGYRFTSQAKDVIGLLDHLRLPRVHLLGFSMGGVVAQEMALTYGDRIGRLILFGTFCGGIWSEQPSSAVMRRLLEAEHLSPEAGARHIWPLVYSPAFIAANADLVGQQLRRELQHPTSAIAAQRQMEALWQVNNYWVLPRIKAATLVAAGAEDVLVKPGNAALIAGRIPNARLELLPGLGHRAIWEAPEEIADLVDDFLTARVPFFKARG
jgi:3-oxoadipate enol-lactonase